MNKLFRFCALGYFLLSMLSAATSQPIIYVAQGASGDGSSWLNAMGSLQAAIAGATDGTQIWVRQGIYYPVLCSLCRESDRDKSFEIPNGVQLFGGFAGNETSVNQRNTTFFPTILSGDIDRDGTLLNNSFSVIYTHNVSNETVADGFVITGGNADQTTQISSRRSSGAGWYNLGNDGGNSHPKIANCVFSGNYVWGDGAAMFNDATFSGNCQPVISNCIFSGNVSLLKGGAIFNDGSFNGQCHPVFLNCRFENNRSESADGGAIYNIGAEGGSCRPEFTACVFLNNQASGEGGAIYNFGKNGNCSPAFINCHFENNEAVLGGAAYDDGSFNGLCNPAFRDCRFINNHSFSDGGAMYNSGFYGRSDPVLINCSFKSNHSGFAGGAIFTNGINGISSPVITNCRFEYNTADTYGGAMYNQGKKGEASPLVTNCIFNGNSALSAGAIYCLGAENGKANAEVTNCTFFGNHANFGGVFYCNAGEGGTGTSEPVIRNSIFWGNSAADEGSIFRIIWGKPTISYSLTDLTGCNELYNGIGGSVNCGPGMIYNLNPMFIDAAAANFHLMNGSPAIDDGDNDAIAHAGVMVDLDSLPRIVNNRVDLGVYEYGDSSLLAPTIAQHPRSLQVCLGEAAEFTVRANGATPLGYQWLKNDVPIENATQPDFNIQSVSFSDEAYYKCNVTNSIGSVASQSASLTVQTPASPGISISAQRLEICEGEELTFMAITTNGGGHPAYQWKLNGALVGFNAPEFSTRSLTDGSLIICELTSSLECVTSSLAVSNMLVIMVDSCAVGNEEQTPDKVEISVYPNPNSGKFIVETKNLTTIFAIRLSNAHGQVLLNTFEEYPKIPDFREVDLTNFPKGIYYLQIISDRLFTLKIIKVD